MSAGQELSDFKQLFVDGLNSVVLGRYSITAAYFLCFYDWIISLDQELALIYPAPWNVVKGAYIFCRYYPMVIAPFHLWGLVGDHDQSFCESYYHAIYAFTIPTILSSQFILMLRTYAFSGRKRTVLAVISIAFFTLSGIMIWVTSKELTLSLLFLNVERSGCFALSDQPTLAEILAGGVLKIPIAYHRALIYIFSTLFDFLNISIVVWYCIRRGTLGPLGKSFLKQGMFVYVVMTALNATSLATLLISNVRQSGSGMIPTSFSYVLPSSLACQLVLILRRQASPTQTELRLEHSHMINEAIEMMHSKGTGTSDGFTPSISTDAQAQP